MTTARSGARPRRVPEFDVYDRMRKALDESPYDNLVELAEKLSEMTRVGITDGMLSNNLNATTPPDRNRLVLWAEACGVDESWLIGDYIKPPRRPRKSSLCMSSRWQLVTGRSVVTYLQTVMAA